MSQATATANNAHLSTAFSPVAVVLVNAEAPAHPPDLKENAQA